MLGRRGRVEAKRSGHEAVVWIDRERAVIVEQGPDGPETVEVLDRLPAESEARFDARAVDEVIDEARVVVSGPAEVRTQFDRAYVALTHRPDRLVDIEPSAPVPHAARPTV
jgi:xanthine/CO dehydrogenase XdhC/CoxF family maturation factor